MKVCPQPTQWQIRLRRFTVACTSFLLRYTLVDKHNGLDAAERFLNDGYGLIVLMNHFSRRDAPQVVRILYSRTSLCRRSILGPVSWHNYTPLVDFFAGRFGFLIHPIVTDKTVERLGDEVCLGDGMVEYLSAAISCLQQGGIVLIAPQAGRREAMGQPAGRPVGSLLAQAKRCGLERIALAFFGLGICGALNYAEEHVGGTNFRKVYEVNIGKTLPARVVTELAGGRRKIDAWIFDYLRQLVPIAYGGSAEYPGEARLAKQIY